MNLRPLSVLLLVVGTALACTPTPEAGSTSFAAPSAPSEAPAPAAIQAEQPPADPAHVASECPTIHGAFSVAGEADAKLIEMGPVDGGVMYTFAGEPLIADNKIHRAFSAPSTSYVAVCKKGVLHLIRTSIDAEGEPTEEKSTYSKWTEEGDIVVSKVGADGKKEQVVLLNVLPTLPRPAHVVAECPALQGTYLKGSSQMILTSNAVDGGVRYGEPIGFGVIPSDGFIVDGKTHVTEKLVYSAVCSGGKALFHMAEGVSRFATAVLSLEGEKFKIVINDGGKIESSLFEVDEQAKRLESDRRLHQAADCPTLNGKFQARDSESVEFKTSTSAFGPLYRISGAPIDEFVADGEIHQAGSSSETYLAACVNRQLILHLQDGSGSSRVVFENTSSDMVRRSVVYDGKTKVTPMARTVSAQ